MESSFRSGEARGSIHGAAHDGCVEVFGCLVVARGSARCLVVHPAAGVGPVGVGLGVGVGVGVEEEEGFEGSAGERVGRGGEGWWPPWVPGERGGRSRHGDAQDVANLVVASQGLGGEAPPSQLDVQGGKLHVTAGPRVLVVLVTAEREGGSGGGEEAGDTARAEANRAVGHETEKEDEFDVIQSLGEWLEQSFSAGHSASLDAVLSRLQIETDAALKSSTAHDIAWESSSSGGTQGTATLDEFQAFHAECLAPLLARPVSRDAVSRMQRAVSLADGEPGTAQDWAALTRAALGPI